MKITTYQIQLLIEIAEQYQKIQEDIYLLTWRYPEIDFPISYYPVANLLSTIKFQQKNEISCDHSNNLKEIE